MGVIETATKGEHPRRRLVECKYIVLPNGKMGSGPAFEKRTGRMVIEEKENALCFTYDGLNGDEQTERFEFIKDESYATPNFKAKGTIRVSKLIRLSDSAKCSVNIIVPSGEIFDTTFKELAAHLRKVNTLSDDFTFLRVLGGYQTDSESVSD